MFRIHQLAKLSRKFRQPPLKTLAGQLTSRVRVDDPTLSDRDMGSLILVAQRRRVSEHIKAGLEEGGRLV
jgi:acyl-CoA reductase-like NAD-dependent aldehyde dehydrogenase